MADIRYAARSLSRAPTFAVTTVVTLALGIGSAVAVFTLLNAILLRPLPFRNAPRLVGAWHALPGMDQHRIPVARHLLHLQASRPHDREHRRVRSCRSESG